MTTSDELIKSIRSAVIDGKMLWNDNPRVISLAKKHDLEHFVNSDKALEAEYRATLQSEVIKELETLFQEINVEYMLLKGAIIRNLYPEPWMRTSSDIDILIHEQDLDRVISSMKSKDYIHMATANNHAILKSPDDVTVELHISLSKTHTDKQTADVLDRAWDYKDSPAMFYCYTISHMAGHFRQGGCGMRSIIDLYFLKDYDKSIVELAGLAKFEEAARNLAMEWMGDSDLDTDTEFESWIINGGVYGTISQAAKARKLTGDDSSILLKRLFPSFEEMKIYYPNMHSKIELPIFWIKRICKHTNNYGLKRIKPELKSMHNTNDIEQQAVKSMFERLELKIED